MALAHYRIRAAELLSQGPEVCAAAVPCFTYKRWLVISLSGFYFGAPLADLARKPVALSDTQAAAKAWISANA